MQSIRSRLALASCALLSQHSVAQGIDNDWVIDSSVLQYAEGDDRVSVTKAVVSVDGNVSTKDSVSLQLVYDTMSGATPTGLVSDPAQRDTVTGVSGGSFATGSGAGVTLAEFDDTRLATTMDWTRQHGRTFAATYGAAVSVENDYQSIGGSVNLAKDTSSRLTTFTAGIAGTFDTISRTGGKTPLPRSNLADPESDIFVEEATRHTYQAIVGMSRVINVRTIAQFNMSIGVSDGYHTDPYKLVSIADDNDPNALRPRGAVYESRPDSRERHTLFGKVAHQLRSGNIMHFSYRWYDDDWEVTSNTFELKYHKKLRGGSFIEPHVRYYDQTAASFYVHYLDSDDHDASDIDSIPDFVSADYRLDEIQSYTVGFKYGTPVLAGGKLRFRMSYVAQTFTDTEFDENNAIVVQLSFKNTFQ